MDEQYKTWKKNCPLLYDVMISHTLEWPSLTFEWFPEYARSPADDYITHRFLAGTFTNNQEPEKVLVGTLAVPNLGNPGLKQNAVNEPGGYKGPYAHVTVKHELLHDGEPNRLRYMPQNPNVIAGRAPSGAVFVFDLTCHPSQIPPKSSPTPQRTLLGCESEGYALAWSPAARGRLLSASQEGSLFLWDVEKTPSNNRPVAVFAQHTAAVEDVAWAKKDPHAFASVGDDSALVLWDDRQLTPAFVVAAAHKGDANAVDTDFAEFRLATAGADGHVRVWDARNLVAAVHTVEAHRDEEALVVRFSPQNGNRFASGSTGGNVCVFDLALADAEQTAEDAADGAPELVFVHAGHSGKVNDLGWNYNDENLLGSVSDDNKLHFWKPVECCN